MSEYCSKCNKKLSFRNSFVWGGKPVCRDCLNELKKAKIQEYVTTKSKKLSFKVLILSFAITLILAILFTPFAENYQESGFGSRSWTNYTLRIALNYYYPFKPSSLAETVHIAPGVSRTDTYTFRIAWEILIPAGFLIFIISRYLLGKISSRRKTAA